MKRFAKAFLGRGLQWSFALVFYGALLAGCYKYVKSFDRTVKLGFWPAEPSLESIDPLERVDAAKLAATKYGGGK
jgi:hypothetical protein